MTNLIKIATWNCADHFPKKARLAAGLDADVLIVQEVREVHASAIDKRYSYSWFGLDGQRGLLIACKRDHELSLRYESEYRHAVALSAKVLGQEFSIVGIWTMPIKGNYVKATCNSLDEVLPAIERGRTIVAGDFNASAIFDRGPRSRYNFSTINDRLKNRGLESIWHSTTGEAYGAESKPTYLHQWKEQQPFHIDYVFASRELLEACIKIEIGNVSIVRERISDHMPLTVEFEV